ncbi:alpha/beta fold hydrolase [Terrabacter sp. Root181]|uniref:alpha/beta fold hydrolase n=1 Tax=Terrabacter sp. Root181 TaxID=1736484 RepID=UPI000701A919|nr:alpha/beta hydrolase [Terrabacter sp. Root181]KRB47159.1 alpha/beta hydrolase [Terrabacter sp. Root181]
MTTFALVPGAGGAAWYWHRVVPLIEEAGHEAVAVELPADDPDAGLPEYADLVTSAVEGRDDVVVVGQSMGGFTVPMVAVRRPVAGLVLLNAMLPLPGETAGAWWDAVGSEGARVAAARAGGYPEEFDLDTYFLHDVDPAVAASGEEHQRPEGDRAFETPCDIVTWPEVPTRVVAGAGDRFFPVGLQRRVAHERLGLDVDTVPGGHLAALSHPAELTAYLLTGR